MRENATLTLTPMLEPFLMSNAIRLNQINPGGTHVAANLSIWFVHRYETCVISEPLSKKFLSCQFPVGLSIVDYHFFLNQS